MARSIFRERDRQAIDQRLAALDPAARPRFGVMTPADMICHMKDAIEVATGAVPCRRRETALSNRLLRWLAIYYMPWPKGKVKTAPEMLRTKPANWDADLQRLREMLSATAARGVSASWAPHPAFGGISGTDYGVLIYRHFDHHLAQFGA
jgi:hypothetical protein